MRFISDPIFLLFYSGKGYPFELMTNNKQMKGYIEYINPPTHIYIDHNVCILGVIP